MKKNKNYVDLKDQPCLLYTSGIVPPGIDGYKEGAWEFCAYDVDKANEYLDKVCLLYTSRYSLRLRAFRPSGVGCFGHFHWSYVR